jgi:hypothetical protein
MKKDNVIDLTERREEIKESQRPPESETMKRIKMRIDLYDTKLMVSTSLLSVLVFATIANSSMFSSHVNSADLASSGVIQSSRAIASVQTGTSNWEDRIAQSLSAKSMNDESQLGRRPSTLDQLTFGMLEGKYAVQSENGKIQEIHLADATSSPKVITNLNSFLNDNKALLLPAQVAKAELQASQQDGAFTMQSFRLIGAEKQDLGHVEFKLDSEGRFLSMRVTR